MRNGCDNDENVPLIGDVLDFLFTCTGSAPLVLKVGLSTVWGCQLMYLYHSLLCLTAAMKMGRDCSVSRSCCRRLHYHCPDCTHSIHCHHLVHFYWCSLLFLACWWRPFLSTWIQSCFGCGIVQQRSDFGIVVDGMFSFFFLFVITLHSSNLSYHFTMY